MSDAAKIGPYTVVRRLGMGGTSEVLLATSRGPFGFERQVVVKRLLPRHRSDPTMARMLAQEAMAYARLGHPAIVRLYDFFEDGDELALVLEHVDGVTLARLRTTLRSRGQRLPDEASFYVARRVFSALAAAHAARDPATGAPAPVIHRDVSPGNVLVPSDGFVKLADFGIAKVSGTPSDTQDGLIKGTDGYMAPEQVLGGTITPAVDVYAACLLLRELLVGAPAFTRGRLSEIDFLRAMAEPSIPPVETQRPDLPRSVSDALRRGLEPDPARRRLDAAEMARILHDVADGERGRASLVCVLATVPPPEPVETTPPAIAAPPAPSPPPPPPPVPPAPSVGYASEGSVRAQVMGTPYAYTPSPSLLPASYSDAPPPGAMSRLSPLWGAVIGIAAGAALVTCGVVGWSVTSHGPAVVAPQASAGPVAASRHPLRTRQAHAPKIRVR